MANGEQSKVEAFAQAALRGALRGVRLGPGVLGTVAPVGIVGFLAMAGIAWALRDNPIIAGVAILAGLLFLIYFVERAFRFAEKNPIPALLGGSDLSQLIRDQMGAKDPRIISDAAPITGASPRAIEDRGGGHE